MDVNVLAEQAKVKIFKGKITGPQVGGIKVIVDAWEKYGYKLDTALAYILATAWWETAKTMQPIREANGTTDEQSKARLENAWKAGKLKWVKTPYWRDGWFGRGFVQITHEDNYAGPLRTAVLKEFPGCDIHADPALALRPDIAAFLLVEGTTRGVTVKGDFTGKALEDYINDNRTDYLNARRTVNPSDADSFAPIADAALAFEDCIRAARTAAGEDFKGPSLNLYDGRVYQQVKAVQQRLVALGYPEVGNVDGRWGSKTQAAVLAFRADNALPLETGITDEQFLSKLVTASPRVIGTERQNTTAADLRREGSKTIEHADKTNWLGIASVGSGGLVAANKAMDQVDQYNTTIQRAADMIHPVTKLLQENWMLILIVIGAIAMWQAYKIKKTKVEQYQQGKTLAP